MFGAKLLTAIGKVPLLSKAARKLAHRYPEGSVTKIKSGLAQGLLWRRHHRYVNGYWLGQYELPVQNALARFLKPGDVFFDVGANAGFFSIVAWKLVGPQGRIISVDPDPANAEAIQEQIELNGCTNWHIVRGAVSASAGKAVFSRAKAGSAMGHLGESASGESFEVELFTLDQLVEQWGTPKFVKMDIEGAELHAMNGAGELLRRQEPKWLVEVHGADCEQAVQGALRGAGYHFTNIDGSPLTPAMKYPRHMIAVR